ncbi:hypothetical protein NM688_g9301 [Phlebia brevispora]|uniref:Uncharacterized protein n=1 Tax=Phlebia brevispora TaxID=194682 RepID=A0ACC1RJ45_9APHY|nr:hypothetical protein NM688_g9301 [Phlebia brevispora]
MSSNLYEALGVDKNASPEDIRKAYKRRALATHPDRLPPTASQAEKEQANEQFRLVNNAYEVLNNAENRKVYDKFGVWPPPAQEVEYESARSYSRTAEEPFGADAFFGRSRRPFAFTDPFELFNSLFGDLHSQFANDPFFADVFPSSRSPFGRSPFGASPFNDPFDRPFGGSLFGPSLFGGPFLTGWWIGEHKVTRTVNGRTETIIKKRDAQGNEHVTYLSPEGERHTINGIEQPSGSNRSIKPPPQPPTAIPPPPQAPPAMLYGTSSYAPAKQEPPVAPVKSRTSHECTSIPHQGYNNKSHNPFSSVPRSTTDKPRARETCGE